MEHNIADTDGIVEAFLDINGEESSKACGVAGYYVDGNITFLDELEAREKKEEESFSTKAKVFCVLVCSIRIKFEYNRVATTCLTP